MPALISTLVQYMVIVSFSSSLTSKTRVYPPILDQEAQDKVRDKAQGRGLLYPDTFSEERLLFLPPATSVLLVIFSRNHNVRLSHVFQNSHP